MDVKHVYVENYGCPSNRFDLGIIVRMLEDIGLEVADSADHADVLLVNTCAVKRPTEDRIIARLRALNVSGKPIIVAGCLPRINLAAIRKAVPNFLAVLDPHSLKDIASAFGGLSGGEVNQVFFSSDPTVKLEMPRNRMGRFRDIVQIAEGCEGSCSFCSTRIARGRLFSYQPSLIVREVEDAVRDGVKEIWITAQDTGAYGVDFGGNLPSLLQDVCGVEGEFLVRVGMMNPAHVSGMLDQLIDVFRSEKLFNFLHLPLQSGSNEVLRLMNRSYTVEDFLHIVRSFRREIPNITIATDIICGFPGEDDESFGDSIRTIEEAEPDVVNVSKFYPRPGTEADKMRQLPGSTVKDRSRRMSFHRSKISLRRNQRWVRWVGDALVDEEGRKGDWIARNLSYKPIVLKSEMNPLGRKVEVTIRGATETYLKGEIVRFL